jgi:hypothetical protein
LFLPGVFDLFDLLFNKMQMRYVASQFGQRVGWNWFAFWHAQRGKTLRCITQLRIEAADAEADKGGFHPVGDASTAIPNW